LKHLWKFHHVNNNIYHLLYSYLMKLRTFGIISVLLSLWFLWNVFGSEIIKSSISTKDSAFGWDNSSYTENFTIRTFNKTRHKITLYKNYYYSQASWTRLYWRMIYQNAVEFSTLWAEQWDFTLQLDNYWSESITPWFYTNASHFPDNLNQNKHWINLKIDWRACKWVWEFYVHEIIFEWTSITKAAIDFSYQCDKNTEKLYWLIRLNSSITEKCNASSCLTLWYKEKASLFVWEECKSWVYEPVGSLYHHDLGVEIPNDRYWAYVKRYKVQWLDWKWSNWFNLWEWDWNRKDSCGNKYYQSWTKRDPKRPKECTLRVRSFFVNKPFEIECSKERTTAKDLDIFNEQEEITSPKQIKKATILSEKEKAIIQTIIWYIESWRTADEQRVLTNSLITLMKKYESKLSYVKN